MSQKTANWSEAEGGREADGVFLEELNENLERTSAQLAVRRFGIIYYLPFKFFSSFASSASNSAGSLFP